MPWKILVVDDDPKILKLIKMHFVREGFAVVITADGSEALLLARESRPDLILTDAEMPGLDGHALCRVLKKEAATLKIPVILMSGQRMEDKDMLAGFEGGADDYVFKPFSLSVLTARVQAVLRRYESESRAAPKAKKRGLALDPEARSVTLDGKPLILTRKEFDLLAAFLDKPRRVLSANYLLETIWGYNPADYNDPGTVEVHVSRLRKKLGPAYARMIVTVTGLGYKLEPEA